MGTWTKTTSQNGYVLTLAVTETSVNQSENNSSVSAALKIRAVSTRFVDYWVDAYISLDGTTKVAYSNYYSIPSYNTDYTICEWSGTISHNANGSKTLSCVGAISSASGTYSPGSATISESMELTKIDRAPVVSAGSAVTAGGNLTVTVTPFNTAYAHTIQAALAGSSVSKTLPAGTTSGTLTIPAAWANKIPNAASATLTVTAQAKSGNTNVGLAGSTTATMNVPSYAPTFTKSYLADYSTTLGGNILQNRTKITGTITDAATSYGATIAAYTINGQTAALQNGVASLEFTVATAGSVSIPFVVTDSRGKTATQTQTLNVRAYDAPRITEAAAQRTTTPTTVNVTVSGAFSSVGGGNALTVTAKLGTQTKTATITGGSSDIKTFTNTFTFTGISADSAFDGSVTAVDTVNTTSNTYALTLSAESVPFDLYSSGQGVAMGKVADTAGIFDCNYPATFRKGVTFTDTKWLIDIVLPVGSVRMFANSTNPNTIYPGTTWTQIKGVFPFAADNSHALGTTGGEATHKLTKSELPYFEEPVRVAGETELNFTSQGGTASGSADMLMHTAQWRTTAANPAVTATNRMYVQITGGNQAHNNMPPYKAFNFWQRTA